IFMTTWLRARGPRQPASRAVKRGSCFCLAHSCSTPVPGGLADKTSEQPAEVRLIGTTTLQRDLAEGSIGRQHQPLGQFHPTFSHVLKRRCAERVSKNPTEVTGIQSDECRQLFASDW